MFDGICRVENHVIAIRNFEDVTSAIIRVNELSGRAGLSVIEKSSVMTAVSELTNNILKYAKKGSLTMAIIQTRTGRGIEIVAEDHGPGITDIQMAMRDHYSESGTLGLGLPGSKRLMDEFFLRSEVGAGTRVTARKWKS